MSDERRGSGAGGGGAARLPPERERAQPRKPAGAPVGMLLNDLHNPFFAEIADGIEDLTSRLGYRLLLEHRRPQARARARDAGGAARVPDRRPDPGRARGMETAAILGRDAVGHRCVSHGQGFCRSAAVDCVETDEAIGARLAVRHLAEAGARADRAHRRRPQRGCRAAPSRLPAGDGARPGSPATPRVLAGEFAEARPASAPPSSCCAAGSAAHRDLRRQRPRRRRGARPARGRRRASAGGRVARRVRQHLPGGAAPHLADHHQPAAVGRWGGWRSGSARAAENSPRTPKGGLTEPTLVGAPVRRGRRGEGARRRLRGRRAAQHVAVAPAGPVPSWGRRSVGPVDEATGFAVGRGRVLTVAHVLDGGGDVSGGRPAGASVVRRDDRLDLAVLAVPGVGRASRRASAAHAAR